MAEVKAGQPDAQQVEDQQQSAEGEGAQDDKGDEQQQDQEAGRTYTQAELDRILGKVRKNARYLGRKEAEAELVRQGASRQQAQDTVERKVDKPAAAPKREDFENYEDFLVAKADHTARQASREEREKSDKEARDRTVTEQRQKTDQAFRKHASAVMAEIPDFAETIESAEGVMITEAMGDAIKEAGAVGPRILYHLVQNPEEAARISDIKSDRAQAREIGKIEARIEAELAAKLAAKNKDEDKGDDGEDKAGDDKGDEKADAEAKGSEADRNTDGTYKSAKKRAAPEPIEPGSARSASGSKNASDKDDISTWMRKENERAKLEGRK